MDEEKGLLENSVDSKKESPRKVSTASTASSTSNPARRKNYFELHEAIKDNNVEKLDTILEKKNNTADFKKLVDELDDKKNSPLHYAVRYKYLDIVKKLLPDGKQMAQKNKEMVNKKGPENMTPLHYAARYAKNNFPELSPPPNEDNEVPVKQYLKNQSSVTSGTFDFALQDPMVEILEVLLEAGADSTAQDEFGLTPLHHAAMRGNIGVIQKILRKDKEQGVQSHLIQTNQGCTPLHLAATYDKIHVIRILKTTGEDLDITDKAGDTALHRAVQEGNLECTNLMIKNLHKETLKNLMYKQNKEGCTALLLSVISGNKDLVRLLLDHDKQTNKQKKLVNIHNNQKEYPLHISSRSGDLEMVQLLLDYDADIDTQNALQQTPLFLAAMNGFPDILSLLIEKKANPETPSFDRYTPLMIATSEGEEDCVDILLLGTNPKLEALDHDEQNVIHRASKYNQSKILKKILESREDTADLLNSNDKDDNTPLHLACENGQLDAVQFLLEQNSDIDNKNRDEQTPCHLATINGHSAVLKLLIEKDRNVISDKDDHYNTCLHLAAKYKHPETLTILLENGANIQAKNNQMLTPLDLACASNCLRCMEILIEKNAPVNPIGKNDTTPLHQAAQFGSHTAVNFLLNCGANPTTRDIDGQNSLQVAIASKKHSAAKAIISCKYWRDAMRTSSKITIGSGIEVPDTPMRMLIRTFPDLAEEVFNKCISIQKEANKNVNTKILVDYEFLDDTYNIEKNDENQYKYTKEFDDGKEIKQFDVPYEAKNKKAIIDNHPLNIMVEKKEKDLLRHPLCIAFLHNKWRAYGRNLFVLSLFHYISFLLAITTYVLLKSVPGDGNLDMCIYNNITEENKNRVLPSNNPVQMLCCIIIIFSVIIGLVTEISQVVLMRLRYVQLDNIMDCLVYVSALVLVIIDLITGLKWSSPGECAEWQFGAVVISISWFNLLQYLRHIRMFGIHIITFLKISKSVIKIFQVAVFPIVAVALPLHMLLIHQSPFKTFYYSILKVTVGIVGEYEYESIFVPDDDRPLPFPYLSVIFFGLWIIVMPIIIVNTIVGLAVDDIKTVRDEAKLRKMVLQVEMVLEHQKYMPNYFLKRYRCLKESLEIKENTKSFNVKRKILSALQERQHDIFFDLDQEDNSSSTNDSIGKVRRELAEVKEMIQNLSHDSAKK